jgi:pimeloyl-ACP methyl ester carboxylesterase
MRDVIRLLLVSFACLAACGARAQSLRADPIRVPVSSGAKTVELVGIVVRLDDGASHALAIVNHGSPRDPADRPKMTPFGMWSQASALARRGWAVAVFLRRGYGKSGGDWAESYGPCNNPDFLRAGRAAAQDIEAVAAYMEKQTYILPGPWISVGVSAGAFATVALTADSPKNLAAAIAFAPGRGSTAPDKVCGGQSLAQAFGAFGQTSRTPLLWVNASNDHFFGPQLVEDWVTRFSHGGGRVTHIALGPFGQEGHFLFSAEGEKTWARVIDRFLETERLKLRGEPATSVRPDVLAPASLGGDGKKAFAAYLDAAPNKAFAAGAGSRYGWVSARETPAQASADAIAFCAGRVAANQCRVVNVNDAQRQ